MANSSDWLSTLGAQGNTTPPAPSWLVRLQGADDFREAPPFAAPVAQTPSPAPAPEPETVSQEDALARAYAEGEAAGRAAALAEAAAEAARQRALRLAFRSLDEAASEVLAAELADTVIALCEGVLADYAADRAALLTRCREAARRIGAAAASLRLHLNPDDLARLDPDALAGWTVIADSSIAPGGLLLEGPDGALRDSPADWRRAIAAAVRG